MNVVVLTPHADDETLGMGGTVAKHIIAGDAVTILLLTQHRDKERHWELARACEVLGASLMELAEPCFRDGELDQNTKELSTAVDDLMRQLKPDRLYIPYPSQHQDHRAAYEVGVRTARISLNANHWHIKDLIVYTEPVSEVEMYESGLKPTMFVDISGRPLELKLQAIKQHGSQNLPAPNPSNADFLNAEAIAAGGAVGMLAAERFCPLRLSL
jgi:LmbE family N-acetylglucosaminyl deacetylase